jgi:homoserine kinase
MFNSRTVRAFAPATVANVSCGFDILGFALNDIGDEVHLTSNDSMEVSIQQIIGDGGRLPLEVSKNTAGVAVLSFLKTVKLNFGVSIVLHKNLPLGSGMGSSAASAVAALMAINELTGVRLPKQELLSHAMEAERIACGSAHADNVAPSLLGGFILIRSYDPLDVIRVPLQATLFATLVHPHLELKTEDSRKILRPAISREESIQQSGNVAALMVALMTSDYDLIGRTLTDTIAEPTRKLFIPGFEAIQSEAKRVGALGAGISGSGPTVYALSKDYATAQQAGQVMAHSFQQEGLKSDVIVSKINPLGAMILD